MPKPKKAKPFVVLVKLMYGPSDGAEKEVSSDEMFGAGCLGNLVTYESQGHLYQSRVPWNGVANKLALWDQGRVG